MNNQSKVLRWSLIIGIVIVLNMFFNYALSIIYKQPEFNVFCPTSQVVLQPQNQNECTSEGGQWTGNRAPGDISYGAFQADTKGISYCDLQFTCRQTYDSAQKVYDRNVFVTLVILGALCVLLGNYLKSNLVLGQSLSLAGVFSFIIASMRYWSSADNLIKALILLIALIILIWVAIKKFKNTSINSA